MKLIALARTIEVEYYGSGHLRDKPGRVRAERKPVDYAKTLPGWGVMGGTWEAIDEINREEEEAARRAIQGEATGGDDAGVLMATDSMGDLELAGAGAGGDGGEDGDEDDDEDEDEGDVGGRSGDGGEEDEEDEEDAWETARP